MAPRLVLLVVVLHCVAAARAEEPDANRRVIRATQTVLKAVVAAAEKNAAEHRAQAGGPTTAQNGDALTALYVRTAAAAASELPAEDRSAAFSLAVAVGLDDSPLLREHALTRAFWRALESDADRAKRIAVLGPITMRGRHDWCQHFAVSAGLTAVVGPDRAEMVVLARELRDMQGGSAFSFADFTADQAGILLACAVEQEPERLDDLGRSFEVADYLPDLAGLPEGLSPKEFERELGSFWEVNYAQKRLESAALILALPPYAETIKRVRNEARGKSGR